MSKIGLMMECENSEMRRARTVGREKSRMKNGRAHWGRAAWENNRCKLRCLSKNYLHTIKCIKPNIIERKINNCTEPK